MVQTIYHSNYWYYFKGDFHNRVHLKCRKEIKILIEVVIGALLLAGLYALFGDVIMPTLKTKISEMFNYTG